MKKKPVLAYILSSIAMVLVCFAYYRRYLVNARETLGLFKRLFQDFSIQTEYYQFPHEPEEQFRISPNTKR